MSPAKAQFPRVNEHNGSPDSLLSPRPGPHPHPLAPGHTQAGDQDRTPSALLSAQSPALRHTAPPACRPLLRPRAPAADETEKRLPSWSLGPSGEDQRLSR